jgi:uncharacterized protein (TIGR02145 family)
MKAKLCLSILVFYTFYLISAQIPQGFTYQAIARDIAGNPIANATIKVKLSVLSDTSGFYLYGDGTYVWEEEQTNVKTNSFGLFTIVLGQSSATKIRGSATSFSTIDWARTPLYIGTKIASPDIYKNLGAAMLWSVPYSMVSDSSNALLKGSKLSVVSADDGSSDALFEVKRKDGQTVFAVYPNAVNVYLPRSTPKGFKGGFAIGGFDGAKIDPQDYFRVTPDSIRIYIDKTPNIGKGATKGGFAIGGFDQVKTGGVVQDLMTVSNDSIRIYIDKNPSTGKGVTKGGFAIGGFDMTKAQREEYLRVTRDSTRVYINGAAKGSKGGFAIGEISAGKGSVTSFTSLTPDNYFIGHESGMSNNKGLYNSFFGYKAGRANTDGSFNTFIGHESGYSNTDGSYNLFIGDSAGYKNTSGFANVFLGPWAGWQNSTGTLNVSLGTAAGAANTTGWQNVIVGYMTGFNNTFGNRNIFVGAGAGLNNTEGSMNVYVGNLTGRNGTTASNNVYIGSYAGRFDTIGSNNVFIGFEAAMYETSSNRLYISNSRTSTPLIYGEFDNKLVRFYGRIEIGEKLDVNGIITATGGNSTNWNTAYGWGNHSGLYRLSSWVPAWSDVTGKPSFATIASTGNYSDLNNKPSLFDGTWTSLTAKPTKLAGYGITDAVNISDNQTIAGNKTFSGTTTVNTPVNATDAVTKAYVDELKAQIVELQVAAGLRIKDIDGNVYKIVTIGSQIWMAENLKTTRYNNGTAIPNVTSDTEWSSLSTGAYCWHDNDFANYGNTYGALYNWYAVNTGNLCPTGWHVPTYDEWVTLVTFLGGSSIAGAKLKETGTAHWLSPNTGADNSSGFSALPGGVRQYTTGNFIYLTEYGYWWSSTENYATDAWSFYLNSVSAYFTWNFIKDYGKRDGSSVRCMKN